MQALALRRGFLRASFRPPHISKLQVSTIPTSRQAAGARFNSSSASSANSNSTSKPYVRGLNPDWSAPVVTYAEVKALARNPKPDILLIDVREKDEVAQGAIPSSVNIPLSVFVDALRSSPEDFQRVHGFPKPRKDQDMIFYCRSGKRSATAADSAKDNGFTKIKNYSGSWLDWVKQTQENDYNL